MKNTIICDIDGTLSDHTARKHYVETKGNKNWPRFYEELRNDALNMWCWELLASLKNSGFKIILVTGRPSNYKAPTKKWLEHYDVPYDEIYFRAEGDFREDTVIKKEILDTCLKKKEILFVVEDRKRVCEMWRKEGITVLQCDEGNY